MLSSEIISSLESIFGQENTTQSEDVLLSHSNQYSYHSSSPPDVVCYITDSGQIQDVISICNQHKIPLIPYGAGTSVEGQLSAINGGVCLSFEKMDNIIDIQPDSHYAIVEPGISYSKLNKALEKYGLFFPVDAALGATIGGMFSTNASGTNAMKYGNMYHNVRAFKAITGAGEQLTGGSLACKTSRGPDPRSLFIGSEGTLGVVYEIAVNLHPIPERSAVAICQFSHLTSAVATAVKVKQSNIELTRLEMMDVTQTRGVILYSHITNLSEENTLFFEFSGDIETVQANAITLERIIQEHGGSSFQWSYEEAERDAIWTARKHAYHGAIALSPEKSSLTTDACVPIHNLYQCIEECQKKIEDIGLISPIVSHVGDGNFHCTILFDPNSNEIGKAEILRDEIARIAQKYNGTMSGEHGVGLGKRHLHSSDPYAPSQMWLRRIKELHDPNGILNPEKIIDPSGSASYC